MVETSEHYNSGLSNEGVPWCAAGNAKFNCSAHYGGAQFGGIGGSLSGQVNGTNTIGSY